ncbi:TIGR04211 family SH3 domain-containing protein [uncultured Vibrio sp.]|uniref:TIGR04211 family SH3 domain-containing protein n=1 Tax=uncultured Vibrio sp. TaxID=114054 RepID=UPI002AA6FF13|nr:TIGR04211 family SH3 domain-containing protein [uncultured Vibrio sp.]
MNLVVLSHKRRLQLAICSTLLLLAPAAQAADILYIKPSLEVLMRKARADNARIIATIPMGTAVELVQGGKDWSRIKLQNGTQGWVRSRFLGSSPVIPMANIRPGVGVDGQVLDPAVQVSRHMEENQRLRKELAACTTDRSTLADKYQTLVGDPASALHTKTELSEARRQVEVLQQQLSVAQIECTVLRKNQSIKWFFTGSMVLLIGWVVGRLSRSSKKRASSSLLS